MLDKALKNLNLSEAEIGAVDELTGDLRSEWPLAKFKLFGSKVTGTADAESDLDILILLPCPVGDGARRRIIHKVFDVNLRHGSNISALIISEEEWENSPISLLPIHTFVEQEGILL